MFNSTVILLADDPTGNRTLGGVGSSTSSYGFGDLGAIFDKSNNTWDWMNETLIMLYGAMPLIAIGICILILVILGLLILRIYGLGNGTTYKAVSDEVANFQRLQRRDRSIIRRKKQLSYLTRLVNGFGLGISEVRREYIEYNLKRAGIYGPGGNQFMTANEYNALIRLGQCLAVLIGIVVGIAGGGPGIASLIALFGCMLIDRVPEMVIRSIVQSKDRAIKKDFFGFYGNLHYNMLKASPTPIKVEVRNYASRELTPEMAEFVNNVADTFDLYGELLGSKYIALDYRELPDVGKLMRLIQQYYEGALVENDLRGFREALLLEKQMAMDAEGTKIAEKCRNAMILVFIILFQVVCSALANSIPDLFNFGSMF